MSSSPGGISSSGRGDRGAAGPAGLGGAAEDGLHAAGGGGAGGGGHQPQGRTEMGMGGGCTFHL